eukprot:TRINITY_DN7570_c0_g1_i2.p1 TRINITY_DN7570_c0_g1~~TRINITY_DN7570_c0_g1_i2.p1  ORF type:complete len:711 (+),score=185.68 TRINITY_DN7570_c0_g1_i2:46-2178(+)
MGTGKEMKGEEVMQAIVIADSFQKGSFNTSFAPLTNDEPACMLPLAGKPLLEYTLQCLAMSGVQDAIIYLTTNSSKVKSWLKGSPWDPSFPAAPFPVHTIVNEDCRSFGDALRDLHDKGIIRHNFILVTGDLVSNLNLGPLLAKHKATAAKDKKAIMTSVYSKGYQGNPLRSKGSEMVLAVDRSSQEVLYYQKAETKSTLLPIDLFQHDEVDVHFDLLDSGIYICSPIVLALFADNFDIQDMDRMINEIIESELIDSTIYIHTSTSEFSCRAMNPYLYNLVYEKVLNRWVYPVVPESRILHNGAKVCLLQNSVYKSAGSRVAKGTAIHANTFIGHGVNINDDCSVMKSNLESGVTIGAGSSIAGSIVMKNTKIGKNCNLTNCIVGENVVLPDNCQVKDKVVIGHNAVLKTGSCVPSGTRISSAKVSDGFSDDEEEEAGEEAEGEFGPCAFNYVEENPDFDSDEEIEAQAGCAVLNTWGQVYTTDNEGSDSSESDGEVGDDDGDSWAEDDHKGDLDPGSDMEEGDNNMDYLQDDEDEGEHHDVVNFKREVLESLQRADGEGKIVTDNLVLEINSSKHAWNTTLCEVNQCVLESVLTLNLDLDLSPGKLLAAVKVNLDKFRQLLIKYSQSKSGQDYYLSSVPELIKRFPQFLDVIAKVLHHMYEVDILGEDAILKWANKLQDGNIAKKVKSFVDWLEEAESSDEDESSQDED